MLQELQLKIIEEKSALLNVHMFLAGVVSSIKIHTTQFRHIKFLTYEIFETTRYYLY